MRRADLDVQPVGSEEEAVDGAEVEDEGVVVRLVEPARAGEEVEQVDKLVVHLHPKVVAAQADLQKASTWGGR